jgi:hypothetical protein
MPANMAAPAIAGLAIGIAFIVVLGLVKVSTIHSSSLTVTKERSSQGLKRIA